jgi:Flp pilus assembly protein TadG
MTMRRRGAMTVEAAFVIPVVILLVVGVIVGGVSVYRHQQAAFLAREAARWASVRAGQYVIEGSDPSPTRKQILDTAVLPAAVGIDLAVEWIDNGTGTAHDWDAAAKDVWSVDADGAYVTNAVRVTITVRAGPDLFGDPLTVRSVVELPLTH